MSLNSNSMILCSVATNELDENDDSVPPASSYDDSASFDNSSNTKRQRCSDGSGHNELSSTLLMMRVDPSPISNARASHPINIGSNIVKSNNNNSNNIDVNNYETTTETTTSVNIDNDDHQPDPEGTTTLTATCSAEGDDVDKRRQEQIEQIQQQQEQLQQHQVELKHKRRHCRHGGCIRIVKSQGLCQRHGAKPKTCRVEGCSKQAQGNFDRMCKAHFKLEKTTTTGSPETMDLKPFDFKSDHCNLYVNVPTSEGYMMDLQHQPQYYCPNNNFYNFPTNTTNFPLSTSLPPPYYQHHPVNNCNFPAGSNLTYPNTPSIMFYHQPTYALCYPAATQPIQTYHESTFTISTTTTPAATESESFNDISIRSKTVYDAAKEKSNDANSDFRDIRDLVIPGPLPLQRQTTNDFDLSGWYPPPINNSLFSHMTTVDEFNHHPSTMLQHPTLTTTVTSTATLTSTSFTMMDNTSQTNSSSNGGNSCTTNSDYYDCYQCLDPIPITTINPSQCKCDCTINSDDTLSFYSLEINEMYDDDLSLDGLSISHP